MKRFIGLFLCLMAIPLIAIQVSGTQSGVWTSDNNPYEVTGDITVPQDQTLDIESGVQIIVNGAYQITAEGLLNIIGTEPAPVTITRAPNFTDLWGGIRLEKEGTGFHNTFQFCSIEGAESALHSINSPLQVNNCIFSYNETGIDIFAIGAITPAEINITGNTIEHSIMSGIELTENSNVTIHDNEIRFNGTGAQYRGAIQISAQTGGAVCEPNINDNYIHDNHKQGITCVDMFGNVTINPSILGNTITNNLTGVYFYNAGGILNENYICDNFIEGDANSGAGVMCYGGRATPTIFGNTFEGNFTGAYIMAGAFPNFGDITINTPQGMNTFGDNIDMNGNNNSIYVNQNSGGQIMAQNNFWTSEDPVEIANTITDGNDTAGVSVVVFDPIASNDAPQMEIWVNVFLAEGTWDSAFLQIIPLDENNEEEIVMVSQTGEFEITDLADGSYYIVGRAFDSFYNTVGLGVYGTQMEPTIVAVEDGMTTLSFNIDIEDEFMPPFLAIGEQSNEFSVPANKLISGFDYVADPYYQYYYQNGDFMSVAGEQVWMNDSWNYLEYNTPDRYFFKTMNASLNDTWQMIEYYDSDMGAMYVDATMERYDIIEVIDATQTAEVTVTQFGPMTQEYFLVPDFGMARMMMYENDYFVMGYDVIDATLTPDGTSFPLVDGNIWYYEVMYAQDRPWELRINDDYLLNWNAPGNMGEVFTGYRIYVNGIPIEEIDFSERSYFAPMPVRETIDITITAFNDTFETEHSNVLSMDIQGNDDDYQPALVKTALHGNYPNPFNPETTISFTIANDSENATISIYNIKGERVNTITNDVYTKGEHSVVWKGNDYNGNAVASGVYFYRLDTDTHSDAKKMILMK